MAHHQALQQLRLIQPRCTVSSVPLFLAPALQSISIWLSKPPTYHHLRQRRQQKLSFSTSSHKQARIRNREKNKNRGVSAIRRTGPRVPLSVAKFTLPEPVWDPPERAEFKTRDDHGLWGFFDRSRKPLTPPEDLHNHGRAWTYAELTNKDWEDLWQIWWSCVRERNWLATEANERNRVRAGYGDFEGDARDETVRDTMKLIRKVLMDRNLIFEEALKFGPDFWKERLPQDENKEQDPNWEDITDPSADFLKELPAESAIESPTDSPTESPVDPPSKAGADEGKAGRAGNQHPAAAATGTERTLSP